MAIQMDGQVPVEVGYMIAKAMVVETRRVGEVWVVGALKVDDGYLEEERVYE
jgi:hypothetical protein